VNDLIMYDLFKLGLFRPLVKYVFGGRVVGEKNIPTAGGAILASNHIAEVETFATPALIRRRLIYPAKAELFKGDRGLPSKAVAWFLRSVGQVPLDRSGGRSSLDGLEPVLEALQEGGLVGIYPEGTRSPDGRLYKGRTGVARMALATGVPVIPVGVRGTKFVKRGLLRWVDHPVSVIGAPLDFSAYRGRQDERAVLRYVTDEIMYAIMKLSGQTYVDAFGTSVKSGSMTPAEADLRVKPRPGGGPAPATGVGATVS
jgi:1-acyl-sn-glycerol-3-phosphate acyltransferase